MIDGMQTRTWACFDVLLAILMPTASVGMPPKCKKTGQDSWKPVLYRFFEASGCRCGSRALGFYSNMNADMSLSTATAWGVVIVGFFVVVTWSKS